MINVVLCLLAVAAGAVLVFDEIRTSRRRPTDLTAQPKPLTLRLSPVRDAADLHPELWADYDRTERRAR